MMNEDGGHLDGNVIASLAGTFNEGKSARLATQSL